MPFFVAGGAGLLTAAARHCDLDIPVIRIEHPGDAAEAFNEGLPVLPLAGHADVEWRPGEPFREGAALALASLEQACALALSGAASALVTGPVAKHALTEVGFAHPGQTEFLAQACGTASQDAVMMLAGPTLRTIPLTVHCALSEVADLLTAELIYRRTAIAARALAGDFGIAKPRIAVAGLNPHAGEGGKFGDEEERIIAPAIVKLRADGFDVSGPHPADALFAARQRATYDVAVCMYHDQALIPLKALDFDAGVNVTLGLPIIRTSADHGTAFGIAGKGLADAGATVAAIRMAGECATRRSSERQQLP